MEAEKGGRSKHSNTGSRPSANPSRSPMTLAGSRLDIRGEPYLVSGDAGDKCDHSANDEGPILSPDFQILVLAQFRVNFLE